MTLRQAEKLDVGDKVKWTDPDGGLCSKVITIAAITIISEDGVEGYVCLTDTKGDYLQCYPGELKKVS